MRLLDRLSVKLAAAFAGVAIAGVLTVALVAGLSTVGHIDRYIEHTAAMGEMMGDPMPGGVTMAQMMGSPRQQFLRDELFSFITAGALAAGLAVVLGAVFAQRFSRPLGRLALVAQQVAAGDLSQRVPVTGSDEFGRLGAAFNSMAESLARAQEQRRDSLADIAHELRTPLSVLQAHIEAMQDGLVAADAEHLAILHEETGALNRLVEDLRTLSLADAGRLELRPELVDLAAVAGSVAGEFESLGQERGVRVLAGPAARDTWLTVRADPARLRQVFANVLSNALRFAPAGSDVTVDVVREGPDVVASVADAGPGIPAGELPLVFERFHRVDRSRSRTTGGSGLGLAIARQLIEAHGGTIWAESEPGKGARFVFRLPAAAPG